MSIKNTSQSIDSKVIARIYGKGRGWAFTPKDFAGLGSREGVRVALHRFERKGTIRRVLRGVYDYPRFSSLLNQTAAPNVDEVARGLARKFGWRIQPSGPAALNLIGLSTQVPARYLYRSDGPSRSYAINKTILEFKQGALKEAGFCYAESGIIVEALKSLGEEHVTAATIKKIRGWLPASRRSQVVKDTRRVTGWIYDVINKVCREEVGG